MALQSFACQSFKQRTFKAKTFNGGTGTVAPAPDNVVPTGGGAWSHIGGARGNRARGRGPTSRRR